MNNDLYQIAKELHDISIGVNSLTGTLEDLGYRLDTIGERIAQEEREMQQLRASIEEVLHRAQ